MRYFRRNFKLNLTLMFLLGLLGPSVISALNTSTNQYIASKTRDFQTSDLFVSSFRGIRDEERDQVGKLIEAQLSAAETEMVAMVRGPENAILIEIHAVEPIFPLYGKFAFADGSIERNSQALGSKSAWVAPEVLAQLNVKIGDRIQIGKLEFTIARELKEAPGFSRVGPGVAPRVYIRYGDLAGTELGGSGSLIFHRVHFSVANSADIKTESLREALGNPDLFLRSPDDMSPTLQRFFRFFRMFLATFVFLVSALSWLSAYSIVDHGLRSRCGIFATYEVLGASRLRALGILLLPDLGHLFVAQALGIGALFLVGWGIQALATGLVPVGFRFIIQPELIAALFAFGLIGFLVIAIPAVYALASTPLRTTLTGQLDSSAGSRWAIRIGGTVFLTALLYTMLGSAKDTAILAGIFFGYLVVSDSVFRLIVRWAAQRMSGFWRLVATQIRRQRGQLQWIVSVLLVVGLLMHTGLQLTSAVYKELAVTEKLPDFFLVNIPESSLGGLTEFANKQQVDITHVSPLILARVIDINGERPKDPNLAKFPVRLTYRSDLLPSESIQDGQWFGKAKLQEGEAEISVEYQFAERNGIRMGDRMNFDVQGVPIIGVVSNLRRVKWTEFTPNFFILVQPGVLEDAPKSLLANIRGLPNEPGDQKRIRFQADFVRNFPDISMIDIKQTVSRLQTLTQDALRVVLGAAFLSLILSGISMLGLILHNFSLRQTELHIQRILGTNVSRISWLWSAEYLSVALIASLTSGVLGGLVSFGLCRYLFDIAYTPNWSRLGLVVATLTGVAFLMAKWSSRILNRPLVSHRTSS